MKQNNRKWILKLTDEQFNCIIRGMEYYHRMMIGQVDVVDNVCEHRISAEIERGLKMEMFPELARGESYCWNGGQPNKYFDKESATAYQIYREMEHHKALESEYYDVYKTETLHSGKAEPIIVNKILHTEMKE